MGRSVRPVFLVPLLAAAPAWVLAACSSSHSGGGAASGDASTDAVAEAATSSDGTSSVDAGEGGPLAESGLPGDSGHPADAGHGDAAAEGGPLCDDTSYPEPSTDVDYRVIVENTKGAQVTFPPSTQSWQLRYVFTVPPLPCSTTWNHENQTFYVWGDVAFDQYGSAGAYPLDPYVYNQIVPQIMVGNVLDGNDASYEPSGKPHASWVMQAQYYWQHENGTNYAQTGKIVPVNGGDVVTTEIDYFASSGVITAAISTPAGSSSISIAKPFPNESPPLYASWSDFFAKGQAASTDLLGYPVVNVETHYVDEATLCPMLPFAVEAFSVPGTFTASQVQVTSSGGLSCTQKLATLGF